MKDIFAFSLVVLFLTSIFGMAAYLIYKQVPGWGWFLFVVFLVAGSVNISVKSDKPDRALKSETRKLPPA